MLVGDEHGVQPADRSKFLDLVHAKATRIHEDPGAGHGDQQARVVEVANFHWSRSFRY